MHFIKCDMQPSHIVRIGIICKKTMHCGLLRESSTTKIHIINLSGLDNSWKYCVICKDEINTSSWNRHETILCDKN